MNSRCYYGNPLKLKLKNREKEWTCQCCFKTIQKNTKPYICNSEQKCIYNSTKANYSYKSCKDCFEWNAANHSDIDITQQSFIYKKTKATLARIS